MKKNTQSINPRHQALTMLSQVMIKGQSLTQVIGQTKDALPQAKALCFGVLRDQIRLQCILNQLLDKPPKKALLNILLMLGIYQLKSEVQPDYASVAETVSLTRGVKLPWASGLVNGVLRRFAREREAILLRCQQTDRRYRANHPDWLTQRIYQAWPDKAETILQQNDQQAPMSLRVNLARISREAYLVMLADEGILASPPSEPDALSALVLSQPVDVIQLPGFMQGLVSVQDISAQLATPLLALAPGLRVLDACCAPGGKTAHLLESEPDLSELVAVDVSQTRLQKVTDNLHRLQLSATLVCADAGDPTSWWDGQLFDCILLDAPCSATGVIRRHPDIKTHRKASDLTVLTETQRQLLTQLWPLLKPGGRLLYATCSILPEENTAQIQWFCTQNPEAHLISVANQDKSTAGPGMQLFAQKEGGDGFYYAALEKGQPEVN